MEVADICCQGRVISVLEGGYGTYAKSSMTGQVESDNDHRLDRSTFCDCALRHVSALVDPYDE